MKKQIKRRCVMPIVVLLLLSVMPANTIQAAPQSVQLETVIASDDPSISGVLASDTGVVLSTPFSNIATQVDAAQSMPWGYTWRLSIPALCEGAVIQSIQLVTNTETEDEEGAEGDGMWNGIFLALYSTDSSIGFMDGYTITEGEDLNSWTPALYGIPTPAIDRGIADGPLFPADLGVAGGLDATWNVSGYDFSEPIGVYIQQMVSGTTTTQTTIESVMLTYDDAGCATSVQGANSSGVSQGSAARLASTGMSQGLLGLVAVILIAGTLSIRTVARRRLY